ncbi:hypothetical protein D3C76_1074910 [compost metagenome]
MTARSARHQIYRRFGAQHPTHAVEVAGDQIDQLHQPMAQSAECLGRNAHASIAHGLVGGSEIPGQLANERGFDTAMGTHCLSIKWRNCAAYLVKTLDR